MADNNDHIIRSVSLEINGPDIDNAFGLQEDASKWWHNELMPAISKELDSYGLSSDIIKIPRLEIEVDIEKETDWQHVAIKQVLNHIKEQIDKHITNAVVKTGNMADGFRIKVNDATRVSSAFNFITAFHTYLETGILPWHAGIKGRDQLIVELSGALATEDFQTYGPQLLMLLKNSPAALKRFVQLIDEKTVSSETIYPVLVPEVSTDLIKVWLQHTKLLSDNSPKHGEAIRSLSTRVLSDTVLTESEKLTPGHFINAFERFIATTVAEQYIDVSVIKSITFKEPFTISTADIENVKNIISDKKVTGSKELLSDSVISDKLTEEELQQILEKNILDEEDNADVTGNRLTEELIREGIYISNAGLVLAAPFLNSLFEHTHLSADFKINSIDKVVCLTGYIASGKRVQSEFELVLPKVLCGIALDTAIDTNVVIEDAIYKEADEMLQSLIGHWAILKDTSVEGLRESFLQRDGKLIFKNNEWLLQVEQKAYDMLLQQVPWNYQWIKLPWMTNLLKTEWVG